MSASSLSAWLGSDAIEPEAMKQRLEALSDEELCHYGLRAYRMNLLALLGGRRSTAEIMRLAREAALSKLWLGWLYHHHTLPRLTSEARPPAVTGLPLQTIRDMQAAGRGIVVVTFHLGHMRQLPSDLAHAGIEVLVPLAADAFGNYESARQANPEAALWKHFRHVCVEVRGGALVLARGLARGACVVSTIDGNTGIDGPRGSDRRQAVGMLDTDVKVKNGLIAMAARFGAAILPVVAVTRDGRPTCQCLPLLDPGRPLQGDAAAAFVQATTAHVYAWFGEVLLESAGEWCGGDLFHQWRLPRRQPERPAVDVEDDLVHALGRGDGLALDASRVMELPGNGERILVDVQSTRCYRFAQDDDAFMEQITGPVGIDQAWLDGCDGARREKALKLLRMLASRHAVIPVRSGALA
ncbi:hypothetical protein L2Y96_20475 [Luteibacter aegosomaticola]|uniref:hypothetical protein n=1 Tax=Luteibacter aegosomaticola TaxID=2911538 RepID=UPI001FF9DC36|nr:hypothetical protein [Luteibacter aegosomaticola]UPG89737.1 hypothetical protein L2Y96_20475 [Luteibacter aegosomaticola]